MVLWSLAFLPNEDYMYVSDGEEFDNLLVAAVENYEHTQEESAPPLPARPSYSSYAQ